MCCFALISEFLSKKHSNINIEVYGNIIYQVDAVGGLLPSHFDAQSKHFNNIFLGKPSKESLGSNTVWAADFEAPAYNFS
jgi:hypothetical protein